TTYSDSSLPAGNYTYRVRATDAANNASAYSNTASGAVPDALPPTDPTGLSAVAAGSTQINLNWTVSTDNIAVAQYLIERCQGLGCTTFSQVGTSSTITYNNAGLNASTTYNYRVRATDAAGNFSGYSNTSVATTAAASTGLLAGYSFNEGTGSTVT